MGGGAAGAASRKGERGAERIVVSPGWLAKDIAIDSDSQLESA
jgi:hypothetical protein